MTKEVVQIAQSLLADRYHDCYAAILAGSILRGEATPTSDLDLVVLTRDPKAPYRESYFYDSWPVEAFVHSQASVEDYILQEIAQCTATLANMIAEGELLRDDKGLGRSTQVWVVAMLAQGPEPLTEEEITHMRYQITDHLDDLRGSQRDDESFLIAAQLAERTVQLFLGRNSCWAGQGKWAMRALERCDANTAQKLSQALLIAQKHGDYRPLVDFADEVLAPSGGRLFAGYRASGRRAGNSGRGLQR